jgi:hypothetical protein
VFLLALLTLLSRQHVATREFRTWLRLQKKTMFLGILGVFLTILGFKNPFLK